MFLLSPGFPASQRQLQDRLGAQIFQKAKTQTSGRLQNAGVVPVVNRSTSFQRFMMVHLLKMSRI